MKVYLVQIVHWNGIREIDAFETVSKAQQFACSFLSNEILELIDNDRLRKKLMPLDFETCLQQYKILCDSDKQASIEILEKDVQ